MQFRTFLESELPKFNAGIKTLKVTSSLLEDVVCNLNRIVFELGEDRSVRERQEVNIEIRNYLDLLKDPELMETIGLTREMIAEKLAELLNEKGLNTKYLVGVAQEDKPKQNIIK